MSYSANRVCALESSFLIHVFLLLFFLVSLNDDETKQKNSGIIEDNVTTKGEGDGLTTMVEDGVVTRGSDSDVTKVAMMVRMICIMKVRYVSTADLLKNLIMTVLVQSEFASLLSESVIEFTTYAKLNYNQHHLFKPKLTRTIQ